MAEMDIVMSVARKYGLIVIEDAAQAIGAEYKGKRSGSIGHYGCFSFFPSKNLGAAGDGGMVVTQESDRANKLKCLRAHGSRPKYHHKIIGGNFRLDALQAAIVTVKLKYLDQWTVARQKNAKKYGELLSAALVPVSGEKSASVTIPCLKTERHIFNQYVIRTSRRDQLRDWLKKRKIETEIYYPVPMHLQECFSYLGHEVGAFPESERAANETLALPIYPELLQDQISYVADCIRDFVLADSAPLDFLQGTTLECANGDS